MRRYALLRPTELAHLAELSERHEELMRALEAFETSTPALEPSPGLLEPREVQIEIRQLRQEALKVMAQVSRTIEALP